jgi:hypothetical protein
MPTHPARIVKALHVQPDPPRLTPVEYAPPVPHWRRRSSRRRVLLALLLIAATATSYLFGPSLWDRFKCWNLQRRCIAAGSESGRVVFESEATKGAKLLSADTQYVSRGSSEPVVWFSRDWAQLSALLSPPGQQPAATLFMGLRRTPSGILRLVVLTGMPGRYLDATLVEPGNMVARPRMGYARFAGNGLFGPALLNYQPDRMFAGKADPSDDSHFTIEYVLNGTRCVIDGWLRDESILRIEEQTPPPVKNPILTPPPPPSAASLPSPD